MGERPQFFDRQPVPDSQPCSNGSADKSTVLDVFNRAVHRYSEKSAFTCMGKSLSYRDLGRLSDYFAAYLQCELKLEPGERIAIQLVNCLQYPIALFGAMKAGLVVVNTNPLYTEWEVEHQFRDADVKAVLVLTNMASRVEYAQKRLDIPHVVVTALGDMHSPVKRFLINTVVKYVKRLVPNYTLVNAESFRKALAIGEKRVTSLNTHVADAEDIAVLQYTGGTTGISKGAMLSHSNLVANMHQGLHILVDMPCEDEQVTIVAPLPLYHIYAFTINCMIGLYGGANNLLIPNPRDIKNLVNTLQAVPHHMFVGLNTLFVALCHNPAFCAMDHRRLNITLSGGMALTKTAAKEWHKVTGCKITEGYGLTETSPIVCFNPPGKEELGTIGFAVKDTELKVIDEAGNSLPSGESGELCVKGPQVMKGYWHRPKETAEVLDAEGWFRTGDIAIIEKDQRVRIVDRAKDMILVSGFNVYPNELENVLCSHPDVVECAAIGVPDEVSGELIKMFVVSDSARLSDEEVIEYMRARLTAYKVPKLIEFRDDLPKTNVGKILRRKLRDEGNPASQ